MAQEINDEPHYPPKIITPYVLRIALPVSDSGLKLRTIESGIRARPNTIR
jgi:hypothetical protein